MNIEDIFKSGLAPTSTSPCHSSIANGMSQPPCQNTMLTSPYAYFPYSQQQNPYQYQPLIHVPKRPTMTTLGEMGASVDMLRAQLTELSKRMETMESKFLKFETCVSSDIFLLKSTLSEHATELLHVRDVIEDTHAHVKKTNELLEEQDFSIDRLADIIRQTGMKTVASNIDLGTIRRRLSRVEDFTGEFYEHFESFKDVKNIIKSLSDHIDECDQDISSFIMRKSDNLEFQSNDGENININNNLETNLETYLETYFSNYEEGDEGEEGSDNSNDNDKESKNDDDDFEKL